MTAAGTSFIGRAEELAQLARWLDEVVPITIVGAPGVGKSRLAEEAADRFGGRTSQVSLSSARDASTCVAQIASALGLSDADESAIAEALSACGNALLVLDDADHVVDALATWIPTWQEAAPRLRILTTSRERLRLRSEHVCELGALSLSGGASSEAAALFRARLAQSTRSVTLPDETLASWCEWLEGLPLALELAAAQAPLLGAVEGARLIDVLSDGFRDAGSKHATLSSAIAWTFHLLTEDQQRALAEVSSFEAPFEAELGSRVLSRPPREALAVLRLLVEKSFLQIASDGRLSMFGAVREFVEEAHHGSRAAAIARLDRELARRAANGEVMEDRELCGAAERIVTDRSELPADASAHVLIAAARAIESRGPIERVHRFVRHGVDALSPSEDLAGRLRIALAAALRKQGELEEAARVLGEAIELDLDSEVRASALIEMAIVRQTQRDLDGASELYEFALQLSKKPLVVGRLHANLGAVAHDRVELDDAEERYRLALSVLGATEDRRILGVVRSHLAILFQERGDLVAARETFERALDDLEFAGARVLSAIHRSNLGHLLLEMGEAGRAVALHDQSLPVLRLEGDRKSGALCLCRRAAAHALSGGLKEAQSDLEGAASEARSADDDVLSQVVTLYEAFVPLGRAILATGAVRDGRVDECRAQIRRAKAIGPRWRVSDDARAAQRILETQLGLLQKSASGPPQESLIAGIESRFFRVPGGEWQDLRRHTAARRILEFLIERGPKSVTMSELQEAAWPGERIKKSAATNRVHVALSQLRQRGLKGILTRDADGYRLDPGLPVHRLALTAPPADEA